MGNCCSSGVSNKERSPLSEEETSSRDYNIADDDHDDPIRASNVSTTTDAPLTPFLETPDTMEMESQHDHQQRSSVDPRLIHLLEYFRNLYMRKKGLFRKVISIRSEELVELLNKVGKSMETEEESNEEAATSGKFSLQKSLSVGAKSLGVDEDHDLKNKRFKFKTVDNKPGGGGSGTAGTKAGGGIGGGGGATGGTKTVGGGQSKKMNFI